MSVISLSKSISEVFPDEINGYRIKPDFRNVLRIFRLLSDPDTSDAMKLTLLCEYFFVNEAPDNAELLFYEFAVPERETESKRDKKRMDWEFDADEIYSDFLREYRIDLFKENPHWYKFLALLAGLNKDCALYSKIHLRFMDLKNYKGEEREKLERAKQNVQIPEILSAAELEEEAAFVDEWSKVGI